MDCRDEFEVKNALLLENRAGTIVRFDRGMVTWKKGDSVVIFPSAENPISVDSEGSPVAEKLTIFYSDLGSAINFEGVRAEIESAFSSLYLWRVREVWQVAWVSFLSWEKIDFNHSKRGHFERGKCLLCNDSNEAEESFFFYYLRKTGTLCIDFGRNVGKQR